MKMPTDKNLAKTIYIHGDIHALQQKLIYCIFITKCLLVLCRGWCKKLHHWPLRFTVFLPVTPPNSEHFSKFLHHHICTIELSLTIWPHLNALLYYVVKYFCIFLHFAWVVDYEKCIVVMRVCVCLSVAACPHYCTDPDVTWGSGRGCPLVVHCWADLQSVHGLRCCGNTMEMRGRAQR